MENRFFPRGTLLLLLLLGLAIRLYDLTDLPFDFHPNKQLRSAMIARAMYLDDLPSAPEWQREMAVRQWQGFERLEPPILETIVAWTYRALGAETLWIGRLYSSLLWVAGGVFLYLIARDLSSRRGAIVGTAYFLFIPYAVVASRSFQADPFMVSAALGGIWALLRWAGQPEPSWRATLLAGLAAGIGPLVKVVVIFPMAGALVGLCLATRGWQRSLRDRKTWVLGLVMLLPSAAYYMLGTILLGELAGNALRFLPSMLVSPRFYLDWSEMVAWAAGPIALAVGLLGVVVARPGGRGLLAGLWAGYLLCGLVFPYHYTTHDYYHLPLFPILALGIALVADLLVRGVAERAAGRLAHVLALAVFAFAVALGLREARGRLAIRDYRAEAGYWQSIGDLVGHSSTLLTISPDYGYRLEYYGWTLNSPWLGEGDYRLRASDDPGSEPSEAVIRQRLEGRSYFVVTRLSELEAQPLLAGILRQDYPVFASGEDFVIFDLVNPLQEGS